MASHDKTLRTPTAGPCHNIEVGVFLMVLYVICLDQASQGLVNWLGGGSPLAEFLPFKLVGDMLVAGGDEAVIPGAYA